MEYAQYEKIAAEIRKDVIREVHSAGSGHPGGSLSAADIVTALYFREMNIDPENPDRWGNFSEYVSALREGASNGMSSADLGRSLFFLEREFSQRGNTPTFDEQQMIMTGADVVTIGIDGKVTGDPNGNLYLERCIADIQFKIAQEYKNQDNHTVTFSASNYYVYNIAGGTRLAPGRGIETNPNESYREFYFDGSRKPISPAPGGEYSFQFFVPENIQETLTTGTDGSGEQFDFTTEGSEGYQFREKWEGYDTYPGKETHKLWKNAPLNATYVVIEGQYSEMDSDNNLVYTGAVSYTIHLGNFGPGRWGDFTIERNHRYIYNVTVQGINSIEVEATTDVENQPGAEGSIVSTSETTKNYALDAHYEQVLLEYDLSAIAEAARATKNANTGMSDAEAISEHLIVTVDTPFQDGLKEIRPYKTFMQYRDVPDDRKPEARSPRVSAPCLVHPIEALEYPLLVFLSYPHPLVSDEEVDV